MENNKKFLDYIPNWILIVGLVLFLSLFGIMISSLKSEGVKCIRDPLAYMGYDSSIPYIPKVDLYYNLSDNEVLIRNGSEFTKVNLSLDPITS